MQNVSMCLWELGIVTNLANVPYYMKNENAQNITLWRKPVYWEENWHIYAQIKSFIQKCYGTKWKSIKCDCTIIHYTQI